jgi:hypothetical protein
LNRGLSMCSWIFTPSANAGGGIEKKNNRLFFLARAGHASGIRAAMLSECAYAAVFTMQRDADILLWRSLYAAIAAWLVTNVIVRLRS